MKLNLVNRLREWNDRYRLIQRTRRDDGAVDPILILGSVAVLLVLTVGGFFAVSGWVNNAQDTNTQRDLDRIALVQENVYADRGEFASTHGDNLFGNRLFDQPGGYTFSGAVRVGQGPNGTNAAIVSGRDHFPANPRATVQAGQHIQIEVTAKRISGTSGLNGGFWIQDANPPVNRWYMGAAKSTELLSNGWTRYTFDKMVPAGVTQVSVPYLQIDQASGGGATQYLITDVIVTNLAVQGASVSPVELMSTGTGVDFVPSQDVTYSVSAHEDGYLAAAKSKTGKFFVRSSETSAIGAGASMDAAMSDLTSKGGIIPDGVATPKF